MERLYSSVAQIIYKVTGIISDRVKQLMIFICCLVIMNFYFFGSLSLDSNIKKIGIICSTLMLIIAVLSIDKDRYKAKWNIITHYSLTLFGVGILLIRFLHFVGEGYTVYAADLIVVFPVFYYVWICRGDHETLYKLLAKAIYVLGLISFAYTFFLASKGQLLFTGNRVAGHKSNSNFLGMLGVLLVLAGMYLMLEYLNNVKFAALFSASIGIGTAYIILSVSRAALLALIICLIVFGCSLFKIYKAEEERKINIKAVLCVLFVIAAVTALGMKIDDLHYYEVNKQNEAAAEAAGTEAADDGTETETEAETATIADRVAVNGDANQYSTGRVGIWKVYARHFSVFGDELSNIEDELTNAPATRAHNNIIEYLFRCGYIVGGLYIIFYISSGIMGLAILFNKKYAKPKHFFIVAVIGVYSLYALVEIASLPFSRCIPCLYFMTIAPIMGRRIR